MLIAARALLGLAGATLAPSTLSLLRTIVRRPGPADGGDRGVDLQLLGRWRDRAAARWGAAGAVLVGSVFLLAVPVMALLLGLGRLWLPEYRDPRRAGLTCRARPCRWRRSSW